MDDFRDGRLKGSWENEKVMKMVVSHESSIPPHLEKRNEVTKIEYVESVHTASFSKNDKLPAVTFLSTTIVNIFISFVSIYKVVSFFLYSVHVLLGAPNHCITIIF